jgi:hypothetical protein
MQHPVFDRPIPLGWFTVVFPTIHDKSVNIDEWFMKAHEWIRDKQIKQSFSAFAHPKNRKVPDSISPVFFFKSKEDAELMVNELQGELV